MKKLLALVCLITALWSASALAADIDPETPLWPAYDPVTGLWGYIDETGAYIFAPEYDVGRGTIGYDTWVHNGVYMLEKDGLWGWFDTASGCCP